MTRLERLTTRMENIDERLARVLAEDSPDATIVARIIARKTKVQAKINAI